MPTDFFIKKETSGREGDLHISASMLKAEPSVQIMSLKKIDLPQLTVKTEEKIHIEIENEISDKVFTEILKSLTIREMKKFALDYGITLKAKSNKGEIQKKILEYFINNPNVSRQNIKRTCPGCGNTDHYSTRNKKCSMKKPVKPSSSSTEEITEILSKISYTVIFEKHETSASFTVGCWNVNPDKNAEALTNHINNRLAELSLSIIGLQEMWATGKTQVHLPIGLPISKYKESTAVQPSRKNLGFFSTILDFDIKEVIKLQSEDTMLSREYYNEEIQTRATRGGFESMFKSFEERVHLCEVVHLQTKTKMILCVVHLPVRNRGDSLRRFLFCCICDVVLRTGKPCLALGDWNCPENVFDPLKVRYSKKKIEVEFACPQDPKKRWIDYFALIYPPKIGKYIFFELSTVKAWEIPEIIKKTLGKYNHSLVTINIRLVNPSSSIISVPSAKFHVI